MSSPYLSQIHVLITGGSAGIGLGLARRYLAIGARVLVTGRDAAKLEAAAAPHNGLLTLVCDIAVPSERLTFADHVRDILPELSVVINNAGIQRRASIAADAAPWAEKQNEIDILLAGPIHLNSLLVPGMLNRDQGGVIINVTSGGAYVPQPFAPIYSACKAALQSYTVTLRHALANTNIRVKELIPPAVATGLAGPGANHGSPLDDFCDAVFPPLVHGSADEIGLGLTATEEFGDAMASYRNMFDNFSQRFPIAMYASGPENS